MIKFRFILLLLVLGTLLAKGYAQVLYPDTYIADYYKVLTLQNKDFRKNQMIHTSAVSLLEHDSLPEWNVWGDRFPVYTVDEGQKQGFHILPVISSLSINTAYPRGYNDGPVWKGRGANADLTFGVKGHVGILHYTIAPVIYYAQNRSFEQVNRGVNDSLYSYQFNSRIDWVQRYGEDALARFSPGQSEVRLIWKNLTLGASTQNIVLGPAQINPILMSNNAGMFPHIDFGTDTPIETKIGDFEFRSIWGIMRESDYFDDDSDNNRRYFHGGGLYYQPSFIPGLSLGMSRVHYRNTNITDFTFNDLFVSLADFSSNQDTIGNRVMNDAYDQMVSANVKWTFEEVGFEAYLELARNDFSNIRSLAREPEHSRAYTIGFTKVHDLGNDRVLKGVFEHTTLGRSRLISVRPGSPIYYTHHLARQGYTHRGQVLGAGIGPGGNGDFGSVMYYYPKGLFGFSFQRIRFNDDFSFSTFSISGNRPFDTEFTLTLKALRFVGDWSLGADVAFSQRLNWYYIDQNDQFNFYGRITAGYRLSKQ